MTSLFLLNLCMSGFVGTEVHYIANVEFVDTNLTENIYKSTLIVKKLNFPFNVGACKIFYGSLVLS